MVGPVFNKPGTIIRPARQRLLDMAIKVVLERRSASRILKA
jgi:hypothetical protein